MSESSYQYSFSWTGLRYRCGLSLFWVSPERKGFPRRGEEGLPPSPPQPRREETRSQPFFRAPSFRFRQKELLEVILGYAGK